MSGSDAFELGDGGDVEVSSVSEAGGGGASCGTSHVPNVAFAYIGNIQYGLGLGRKRKQYSG